jgi:hypothetical protein
MEIGGLERMKKKPTEETRETRGIFLIESGPNERTAYHTHIYY